MLILELFELNQVVKINCTATMNHRTDPKPKTTQYCSLKEYVISKENSKKHSKPTQLKSTLKTKPHKNDNHSHSKLKLHPKTTKNNENFNSVNLATDNLSKIKSCHHDIQHLKKDTKREDRSVRNSTERLYKSKSAVRICPKSSRLSPSPLVSKDHPADDKPKTHRQPIKSEKEKKLPIKPKEERPILKKSGSMATIQMRKEQTERERVHNNRVSIKTEGSSKMNSVIRQDQKARKIKKKIKAAGPKKDIYPQKRVQKQPNLQKRQKKSKLQQKIQKSILYSEVSFQQFCQPHPSQSELISNDKLFVSVPGLKMKTEGWQVSLAQPRLSETTQIYMQNQAAIKIQKIFRGYITRKYIEEAKFIIGKVKTIQCWWRGVLSQRKQKRGRPLSIESSLITIKDFNETMKTERLRNFSQSKENTLSNNKVNIKQLIKNILQEQQQQEDKSIVIEKAPLSIEQLQSPHNKSLTKEVYIQDKIKGQIHSEKIFNSPKCMNSPNIAKTPTNTSFTIKEFFTSSNQKQKIKDMLQSPRVKSPQPPKATPQSNYGKAAQEFQIYHSQDHRIAPFETHFGAIEEFCLLLVNFFRDRVNHMGSFLEKMQQIKYHRTWLTMKNWNSYKLIEESQFNSDQTLPLDYEFLQSIERPTIFPLELRDQILRFPQIEIQLNSKHFDLQTSRNRPVHRCFLQFVFDVMEEAFYQPYKYSIVQWKSSLVLQQFKDPQTFFENIFATALGQIFNWGEVMCGIILDSPEEQEQQRQARQKVMQKRVDPWDMGLGSRFGIKVEASEEIVQELIEEMTLQMMSFLL